MVDCPGCGRSNSEDSRFCGACGAELEPDGEVRKLATIVFCDLVGSTALAQGRDPEAVRRVQLRYFDGARAALERHGGTVEKFIGDAVMAVFGIPRAHEDDAVRASRAALEVRRVVESLGLSCRIGVNTGEVVAGSGDALVTGDAVNLASRLEHAAPTGEILLGEETLRLARGAVEVEGMPPLDLKGVEALVIAHRLVMARDPRVAVPRADEVEMVGRDAEMTTLLGSLDGVLDERRCRVVTVVGAPGLGKTRLLTEFVRATTAVVTAWTGRCLSYGDGMTFWPLREIFEQAGAGDVLARALALPAQAETFRAIRVALEERARERPLVLVVEDIHWAEETLFDLISHLSLLTTDAPILVVCSARPELLDEREAWAEGHGDVVELEGLGATESERLLRMRDEKSTDPGVLHRIVERAEGNPLFLEEMLSVVNETAGVPTESSIPTTIQAVLLARLERLSPQVARIAGVASVEGRAFHSAAVAELTPADSRLAVPADLAALARARLARAIGGAGPGEPDFEFRHQLIRDAAYSRLAKSDRAELHERFVRWLDAKAGPGIDEIAGYHLEQAVTLRGELDPDDGELPRLADQAAERLWAVGARAFDRSDVGAAGNLLGRALSLLPADDPRRRRILPDLGAALSAAGDSARADDVLETAEREAQAAGDLALEGLAAIQRMQLRLLRDPVIGAPEARRVARRWIDVLGTSGNDRALGKAWFLLGTTDLYAARYRDMEASMHRALEHAERADDRHQQAAAMQWLSVGIRSGPVPAADGIARIGELLRLAPEGSEAEAGLLVNLGVLHGLEGSLLKAREHVQRGRGLFRELGMEVVWSVYAMELAEVEHYCGDPALAESELSRACARLEELGERDYLSTATAYLGRALLALDRDDEALERTRESEALATSDDMPSQVTFRTVRARVLARRGAHGDAERMSREALGLAETGDDPVLIAEALSDLAEVLSLAGKQAEARSCLRRALRLYRRKGATALVGRVRERLAALEP
ncbi:MAG: tetratricopeptide repeat protein [Actinomycetota bacterium]|nr:tetratricopeptide repeat protein [Actinomycetota bacterium]